MTLLLALVLLGFVLEDDNLLVLALSEHFCGRLYGHVLSCGNDVAVGREKHGKLYLVADSRFELFNLDDVAFGNSVLFSACFNYCVRFNSPNF